MPSYFPENNTPHSADSQERSLQKIANLISGGGVGGRWLDTISDLKAETNTVGVRNIRGYSTSTDGVELPPYYADTSDTSSSDDGFSVIVADDGTRWKPVSIPTRLDIKLFGHRADGINVDADKVTNAETYVAANGLTLYFSAGTYLDVELTRSNYDIALDDRAVFKTSDSTQGPAFLMNGCDNVSVHGRIRTDGNKANNTNNVSGLTADDAAIGFKGCTELDVGNMICRNAWGDGVSFENVSDSVFGNIFCKNSANRGVVLGNDFKDSRLGYIRSVNTDSDHGVRIGSLTGFETERLEIQGIHSSGSASAGCLFETACQDIGVGKLVSRNNEVGAKIEDAQSVNINHLSVYGNTDNGLTFNTDQEELSDIRIDNIESRGNGTNTATEHYGIRFSTSGNPIKRVTIGNATITNHGNSTQPGRALLVLIAGGGTLENVSIDNLTVENNQGWGVWLDETGTVDGIKIGKLYSKNNDVAGSGDADIRIESGVRNIQIDSMDIGTSSQRPVNANCKALKYTQNGGGWEYVQEENTLDLSSSSTWSGAFPGRSIVDAIGTIVTTEITFGGGGTQWQVGDGSNADRWGTLTATVAAGTQRNIDDFDGDDNGPFYLANGSHITVSPDAGSFTAGAVRITVSYRWQIGGNV